MSGERARRVRELFDAASALPPERRDAWLESACDGDPALRDDVARLLRSDARDDLLLDRLVSQAPGDPQWIGSFRVVRRIGRGGMGTVYEAVQDHPSRPVAIKLLRPGSIDDDARRRFRLEAEILGELRHDNIARVYQWGEADLGDGPQPYLVMELIDGVSPLEHARRARLGVDGRLRLLAAIADGVGHAHARGVIHRDLKAANIPVDRTGTPRIVDFGVARRLSRGDAETRHTQVGQLVGTIDTMSPEQARGDRDGVNTRSDVYALGVVGYELLCGERPYSVDGLDLVDALRVVRDVAPMPLGKRDPRLRGDVEVVIGKALAKDPAERYGSASELADELRRCLADEPIIARPPTVRRQLRRLVRRHRAIASSVVVAVVALFAAVVVMGRSLVAVRGSARAAQEALTESEQVTRFLEGLLRSADPVAGGPDLAVADVLHEASRRIEVEFGDRPALAGRLLATNGASLLSLGHLAAAERDLRSAWRRLEEARGPSHPSTLSVRQLCAHAVAQSGQETRALKLIEGAHDDAAAAFGEQDAVALSLAIDAADLERRLGARDAVERLRELRAACDRHLGAEDAIANECRVRLASALLDRDMAAEAVELLEQALQTRRRLLGPAHVDTAEVQGMLAHALLQQGRYEEATAQSADVAGEVARALGERNPRALHARVNHAVLLVQLSQLEAAIESLAAATDDCLVILGERHLVTMTARTWHAHALTQLGRVDEATPIVEQLLAELPPRSGRSAELERLVRTTHVYLLNVRGDAAGALAESLELIDLARADAGSDAGLVASLYNAATLEYELDLYDDAEAHLEEAIERGAACFGPRHPHVLNYRAQLADVYLVTERAGAARDLLEQDCAALRDVAGPSHLSTLYAELALARARHDCGVEASAVALLDDLLPRCDEVLGVDHETSVIATRWLAGFLRELGRHDDAESALRSRDRACAELAPRDPRRVGLAVDLAELLRDQGRDDEAAEWAARVE